MSKRIEVKDLKRIGTIIMILLIILLCVLVSLIQFLRKCEIETTKQQVIYDYTVEKNGIAFENGTLTINAVDEKGQQQTINLRSVPRQNIIEVRRELMFIVSTYFADECVSNNFICRDGKSWEKFMNFIHNNTHLIGFGSIRGTKTKLYIF